VQAQCSRQEHGHLPTRDRRVRTVVSAATAAGDSGRIQRFDESVKRMSDRHVGECCRRRIGANLQLVADTYRRKDEGAGPRERAARPDVKSRGADTKLSVSAGPGIAGSRCVARKQP
jgi:hypothetical protein